MASSVRARPNHRRSLSLFTRFSPTLFLAVARTMRLHEAGRLGFCQQALQGTEAILGTGNSAQLCSAGCPKGWNPKAHRMAYLPSHLFDSAAERRNRVQGDAGAVAAFLLALNLWISTRRQSRPQNTPR